MVSGSAHCHLPDRRQSRADRSTVYLHASPTPRTHHGTAGREYERGVRSRTPSGPVGDWDGTTPTRRAPVGQRHGAKTRHGPSGLSQSETVRAGVRVLYDSRVKCPLFFLRLQRSDHPHLGRYFGARRVPWSSGNSVGSHGVTTPQGGVDGAGPDVAVLGRVGKGRRGVGPDGRDVEGSWVPGVYESRGRLTTGSVTRRDGNDSGRCVWVHRRHTVSTGTPVSSSPDTGGGATVGLGSTLRPQGWSRCHSTLGPVFVTPELPFTRSRVPIPAPEDYRLLLFVTRLPPVRPRPPAPCPDRGPSLLPSFGVRPRGPWWVSERRTSL